MAVAPTSSFHMIEVASVAGASVEVDV